MRVYQTLFELPIRLWCEVIEDEAWKQAHNLAKLPFAWHHVALMPDCHTGFGMPIGGVLATAGVVIPNAVGVDIGCGMCAVRTNLSVEDYAGRTDDWKAIIARIRKQIPVGPKHSDNPAGVGDMPIRRDDLPIVAGRFDAARFELGTLGGGNHFIEIQKGSDGFIWVMIHSGSRNVGYQVANHYNAVAVSSNRQWHSSVPPTAQLAFLPTDSAQGLLYLQEMQWCIEFARKNRAMMMNKVLNTILQTWMQAGFEALTDVAHNYAAMEYHFARNVIVHRKGATRARRGKIGIIPGSQGTCSYVVEGLGNPESFMSCSHGAGRTMSRKAAREQLSLAAEMEALDQQGIIHTLRSQDALDEAPGAYKPIADVMAQQADLVRPLVELRPLAVIKG
ncbi:RtcB family protein [Candidatus Pacearchaeota archaeon]|jgi:tRNA-splicing ligase RtcB|nr:RtcB family protein [Candidatus Pacearchaeota archaeon]